jgi:Mg/Co/Ni transporter MgtE
VPLTRPERRPTALAGLPVLAQADVVANMPTDKAAGELLELTNQDAARVINRCDDVLGGNLLSAIAIPESATARKILQMLLPGRQGPLADHMSSIALAAVLAIPPSEEAVRLVDHADLATVVGAVAEMPPVQAATFVVAMDAGRCTDVLRRIAPERVADIMRSVFSASLRNELVGRLPEHLRNAVRRHLSR